MVLYVIALAGTLVVLWMAGLTFADWQYWVTVALTFLAYFAGLTRKIKSENSKTSENSETSENPEK